MNMQAMLKQAQNLKNNMMKAQEEINKTEFIGENGLVKIIMNGTKKISKVEINSQDDFTKEDIEMLEDMIMVAVNDAIGKVDKMSEEKLGKYTNGIPGLF